MSFRHILFPVDFSRRCEAFWPYVAETAGKFGARVTVLHALQTPEAWYGAGEGMYSALIDLDKLRQDMLQRLDEFPRDRGGLSVEKVLHEGNGPIAAWAKDHGVDLIMLPTHGYGPFRRFLLGSNAARILHDAHCPVWTDAHVDAAGGHLSKVGSILCAVNGEPECAKLIGFADEIAGVYNAKLRLVHAVGLIAGSPEMYEGMDFTHFLIQAARDSIARIQSDIGTSLPIEIRQGNVTEVVKEMAQAFTADLVIAGRGGEHSGAIGRLRSHSYAIVRDSPCPVLSM